MTDWDFLTTELATLEQAGLLLHPRTVESAQGAWMMVDGKRVLNLCSNNYLGLANHPRLREAAHAAIERFGVGPAAVRQCPAPWPCTTNSNTPWRPSKASRPRWSCRSDSTPNPRADEQRDG